MDLLILDTNAIYFCDHGGSHGYLGANPALEFVPVRTAREEIERGPAPPPIREIRDLDAPVPMLLNQPERVTNDPAAVLISPRMAELIRRVSADYPHPANHSNDIEVLACALAYAEVRLATGSFQNAYLVTRDIRLCNKAYDFLRREKAPMDVLQIRLAVDGASRARNIVDVYPRP